MNDGELVDFVGKFENFEEDWEVIRRSLICLYRKNETSFRSIREARRYYDFALCSGFGD